jgi:hypothetical protein
VENADFLVFESVYLRAAGLNITIKLRSDYPAKMIPTYSIYNITVRNLVSTVY